MSGIDVSIVLNVHCEQDLLYPTLRSLLDTVEHAHLHDIKSELVIIADCADETTLAILKDYDYSGFDAVKIEIVQVCSLGLARNAGIQAANGDYIVTADADDLVSRNFIYQMYQKHQDAKDKKIVCFPEYYHAFGDENYVCRFYPLEQVGLYRMASEHPYVSRFMARRKDLLEIPYRDCSTHAVYAYEDYDLNLRLVCAGFDLVVAEETIVFYRQRSGSIMASLGREQKRIGFNSGFFCGPEFLRLTAQQNGSAIIPQKHLDFKKSYIESSYLREFIRLANQMDPEVQPLILYEAKYFTNVGIPEIFGWAYEKICHTLGRKQYTDVFFLPFLSKGGGEKYILNFIQAALKKEKRSCLLILGEKLCRSIERCKIPEGLDVIDLPELLGDHAEDKMPEMAVRIIENFAPKANIFMKFCPFCVSLLKDYANFYEKRQLIYFYFCSPHYIMDNIVYEDSGEYRFLYDYKHHIDYVVSDHCANLDQLERRIPAYHGRTHTLYTSSQPVDYRIPHQDGSRRLIWASRLDSQKRPDILRKIARALLSEYSETEIHVYGSPVLDNFNTEYFEGCPNIVYEGQFSGLESIPFTDRDAFLYTSLFDGLPNVLLEAAQMGVPVITVDVGGIPELIGDESGFLVHNSADDVELVRRYVRKIKEFLNASPVDIQKKVNCLRERFEHQHAQPLCDRNVSTFYAMLEKQRVLEGA
ncbi:glycosyltransferase [Acetobacter malorum]|uniref:Glycosyltransferase 2-like domain-containing protein n=1 Tax=Acetobacter malorum TaxID=178901 RepID=A0A1Y3G301_9PROT|nr:glycosyltransferase [Acetobacter malorum]OUJ04039.1 hypothetical protein HK23_10000 [Acetobacter malorum]